MKLRDVTFLALIAMSGENSSEAKLLVRLKSSVSQRDLQESSFRLQSVAEDLNRAMNKKTRSLSLPHSQVLIVDDSSAESKKTLLENPDVAYVEEDREWKISASDIANETPPSSLKASPWLKDLLGLGETAPSSNVQPLDNPPVLVAVVDSGVNSAHPYLSSDIYTNELEANGKSGVDDDGNGIIDDIHGLNAVKKNGDSSDPTVGHGTHVAGLVKTVRDQALNAYPEARQVQILPVRFIGDNGSGSTSGAIIGLEYAAAMGAKVINCSWGATGAQAFSRALYDTMADLYQQDVLIVAAAGNAEGDIPNNNDVIPDYPSGFNIPGLINVASVTPSYYNSNGLRSVALSFFSNYGKKSVDVAAPGAMENKSGREEGLLSSNSFYAKENSYYVKKMGTSMASPLVAGIAGVVRAINPSLTAFEVRELLMSSAKKYSNLSRIKSSAIVNAQAAFEAAIVAQSQGLQPELPTNPSRGGGGTSTGSSEGTTSGFSHDNQVGGCGSVKGPGDGPMGGNSLGLVLTAFALFMGLRAVKKRFSKKVDFLSSGRGL